MIGERGITMAFLFPALSKEQSKSKLYKNTVRCKTNLNLFSSLSPELIFLLKIITKPQAIPQIQIVWLYYP